MVAVCSGMVFRANKHPTGKRRLRQREGLLIDDRRLMIAIYPAVPAGISLKSAI
jgi:hypothetical protein